MRNADKQTATARPWQWSINSSRQDYCNVTAGENLIAQVRNQSEANAKLIVRAVNSYDALVDFAEKYVRFRNGDETLDSKELFYLATQALAQA